MARQAPNPTKKPRLRTARFTSRCATCDSPIPAGAAYTTDRVRRAVHPDCWARPVAPLAVPSLAARRARRAALLRTTT